MNLLVIVNVNLVIFSGDLSTFGVNLTMLKVRRFVLVLYSALFREFHSRYN
ncbi:hypothetical protein VCRA2120O9_260060 [Vibrio crassostreae]|nr:hypothetical protein VCRA2110O2_90184 [Vibrio crassostreae]CAK3371257.1 hypothetical protein VCRA2120O9_260060 [Vibrio crassostreae]